MSTNAMISAGGIHTSVHHTVSTPISSNLHPPSNRLSFNTHIPKSRIFKSIRTTRIKASAIADTHYVNTDINFYNLLGVPETVTLSEIKKAYKQLARKYHPDVSPPGRTEEYTKRFIQVQEAYETLSDPQSRAIYDRGMCNDTILSCRRRSQSDAQGLGDRSEWEQRWQSQLAELIRRSNSRDLENMSWGARMRSQRNCSS